MSEHVRSYILGRMKIGPTEAAKISGVARSTIYKDMEEGRISFEKSGKGKKVIDASELERVYGPFNHSDVSGMSEDVYKRHVRTDKKDVSDNVLSVEIKMLREQIQRIDVMNDRERATLEKQIEDLRSDRDNWQSIATKQTETVKLLTDQSVNTLQKPVAQPKGLWGRLWR